MELAEIFRAHGSAFREAHRLCGVQHRAMRAIEACRTVALGGHAAACDNCGATLVLHPWGQTLTQHLHVHALVIRRFLLHVLPRGFVRIRHYGLTSSRDKQVRLDRCRQALDQPSPPKPSPELQETLTDFWRRVAACDLERCPACQHGTLRLVAILSPTRPSARGPPPDHG